MEGGATVDPLQEDVAVQIKKGITEPSGSSSPDNLSMKSEKSMEYGLNFKVQCVSEESSASASDVVKRDQTRDVPEHQEDHQPTDQRVCVEEPPTPSYLSMKSDKPINLPIGFRRSDQTHKEDRSGEVLCDICSEFDLEKRAVKTCQTCSSSYCETHVRKHYTEARYQNHHLVDMTRGLEQRLCQDHHRPLELFCRTDHMLICSQCSGTKHRGHDIHHQTELAGGKLTTFDREHHIKSLTSINVLPPPGEISFLSVTSDCVTLRWEPPEGLEGTKKFKVTWEGDGLQKSLKVTDASQVVITGLQPGQQYEFSVTTEDEHGNQSKPASAFKQTVVPPPRDIKVVGSGATSFVCRWSKAEGMEHLPQDFIISYHSPGTETLTIYTEDCCRTLTDLEPGTKYTVSVSTLLKNGEHSEPVSTPIWTKLPIPTNVSAQFISATSVKLTWDWPVPRNTQHHFKVKWSNGSFNTKENWANLTGLSPETEYTINICTIHDKMESEPVTANIHTKCCLDSYLKTLGLDQNSTMKLTLNATLAITGQMLERRDQEQKVPLQKDQEHKVLTPEYLLGFFLRELMIANVSAREKLCSWCHDIDVNPLDLITALFLCSDHLLQQEIALKMSMCQFAVPLLLPNCDTEQSTLMLWAMRDIVKRFRPQSLKDQKGFVENSIVLIDLPMVSFVRLGNSSLSKSELLNELLSKSQQSNCSFVHQNMMGGNILRQISDGLVEINWYLPIGNANIDVFPEPVAVANLRGDIQDFQTQFQFLCKTSAAVIVFCDDFGSGSGLLNFQHMEGQLFIVSNTDAKGYDAANIGNLPRKPTGHIMKDSRMKNIQFVKKIHSVVTNVLKGNPLKFSVENMKEVALECGIEVDEESLPCQDGKKRACSITDHISDTTDFKKKELPLHEEVLELTNLEREESQLKCAGDTNIETYKDKLHRKKVNLRRKQVKHGKNYYMSKLIDGLRESKDTILFLKWMKMNLDNLSRTHLIKLKEEYKTLSESSSVDQKALSDLESRFSTSSLGTEHFLREMGQLYESAQSLPKDFPTRMQFENLPGIGAQLMLDGFPLELIDGDASHIPMMWISAVLEELHRLTSSKSKVRVITVLGVQSSGKSTLLNTMFGVQFAVSSGSCTRGAFMQLIRVEEDLKEQLHCDFLMIIDTEGLKAPALAQLANCYEHDNELATLVVGLSDITIINITMENAAEMKDTMQIVVHAFLRMKEVGKKHMCQFVHQNVSDCSAHDKTAADRKHFLQDLNTMTLAAAKMESKEDNKKFTDIMVYDPDKDSCYLPGLWHGNPPMAPVNEGYSGAVNELKKGVIQRLSHLETPAHSIRDFCKLTRDLWNAVKHENFIFSFRNSLEADAYNSLSVELNKWELELRNHMQSWWQQAEVQISNYGTVANRSRNTSHLEGLKVDLRNEFTSQLEKEGQKLLQKLENYFDQKQNHAHLLVKYKENFINSAMVLKVEIKNSLNSKLDIAVESKRDMIKIEELKKNQSDKMEKDVIKLLDECREIKPELKSDQIKMTFDKMWNDTVKSLDIKALPKQDIDTDILIRLRSNMERRGGGVHQIINSINRLDNYCPSLVVSVSGSSFKKKMVGFVKYLKQGFKKDLEKQAMAEKITTDCNRFVEETLKQNSDYHSIHAIHLLRRIDDTLEKCHRLKIDAEFETRLKIEICGHASREFQKMHITFLEANDNLKCLDNFKSRYFANFKDLFQERDQCQKKAEDFTTLCLQPAVRAYVNKSVGRDIVNELVQTSAFSTRPFFQFSILEHLLSEGTFDQFVGYIKDYRTFVKQCIVQMIEHFFSSGDQTIAHLEVKKLEEITRRIEKVIENLEVHPTSKEHTTDVCSFIRGICQELSKDLVIPKDALNSVLHLNKAQTKPFADRLKVCVPEMKASLSAEFHKDKDVTAKLGSLPSKPQDELFDRMIGCGHQCPFCDAPCEAGEKGHKEHFTTIHRPQGLGWCCWGDSEKLVVDICSSLVTSDTMFKNSDTKDESHPYKDYRSIYPDWRIQPDSSIQASDYWKYVFAKYNQQFADECKAKPAVIPHGWHDITKDQAMESLEKSYRLKAHETKVAE